MAIAVVLLAAACTRRLSPDVLYQQAESLLRQGRLQDARATAETGFGEEPGWRFRLLRIEILLQIDAEKASQAIDAAGEPADPEQRARLEMYRGWARFLVSDYAGAEAALGRARDLAATLDAPLLQAEIEIDRGTVFAQKGDSAEAEEILRAALAQAERGNDANLRVRALGSLGWFLLLTHHPDEAIYWLEQQRDVAQRLGWPRQLANALGNLGSAYHRLGDYDKALPLLREAERRFADLGDQRQQQMWLGNVGNVLLDSGEYAQSIPIYTRAAALAREIGDPYWIAWWEYDLASAYTHLGNFDEAERHNNEALRLKRSIDAPDFYPVVNQADIASGRGNFARAEKLYRAILAAPSFDPVPLLSAESGLSDLLVKTGQMPQADAQFRSGIEALERRRASLRGDEYKLSYFSSLIDFYQRYVDFLVARGEAERALEVAESSRARILDERLNANGASAPPPSAAAFGRLARSAHAVILCYWLAADRSFLWVITPDSVTLHELPSEKQIAPLVESYRTFIENLRDPLESEYAGARKLSAMLLGPVRGLLSADTRLIIVPDRALHSLNFETLPDPADPSHYLIDRATVTVAPSLTVLAAARRPSRGTRGILLIGNPEPAVEEFPRLPNAARELDLISRDFASDRTRRIEGAAAYPAAYAAAHPAEFSWIHFAAHAYANREDPLDSALILSRHGGSYALSAREIMEIPLNADLVTLSACRSAGAKTYSGEGLVGLSWAFLRAGAKNVVAGLWDVTDTSTASLMADFYQEMTRGATPAEALRAAKLRLIHSSGAYRKPFYWGPFQLYSGAGS